MNHKFILSCCSTVDLPYQYLEERHIRVLFYHYVIGNEEFVDDMGRDPEALPRFYQYLEEGNIPSTSQISIGTYEAYFEELLKDGDILHIAFSSGQSGSVNNAYLAAESLREKYPERKIMVADSLCSSSGYGMLVDMVADMRDNGAFIGECARWITKNRNRLHHQFFSTNMTQFRRTGRVSGAAAAVATIMSICPLMRLDATGSIKAYSKVRGKMRAISATVDAMEKSAQGGREYNQKCFVCHSHCPQDAYLLIDALEDRFPNLKGQIRLCEIGTIIAAHSGPGTVAVFFMGDSRPAME